MKKLLFALLIFLSVQSFGQTKVATVEVTQKLNISQYSGTNAKFWWNGIQMKRDSIAYHELSGDSIRFRHVTGPWSPWFKNGSGTGAGYDYWTLGVPANVVNYGYLYNFPTVIDSRGICASNAHVPSKVELDDLFYYPDGGAQAAFNKFCDTNQLYWLESISSATNEYLFSMRGSGTRMDDGSFANLGMSFDIWSSTNVDIYPQSLTSAWNSEAWQYEGDYGIGVNACYNRKSGLAIRLIVDTPIEINGNTAIYIGNDGRRYKCVLINGIWWLAENLAETKYRNGDLIPVVTDNTAWSELTTGARCSYELGLNSRNINNKDIVIVKGYNGIVTEIEGDTIKIKGDAISHSATSLTDNILHWDTLGIDASVIKIVNGTANKWLSLDANKNIIYNDTPTIGGGSDTLNVHKAGTQTITGKKLFVSNVGIDNTDPDAKLKVGNCVLVSPALSDYYFAAGGEEVNPTRHLRAISGYASVSATSASFNKIVRGVHGYCRVGAANTQNWTGIGKTGILAEAIVEAGATGTIDNLSALSLAIFQGSTAAIVTNMFGIDGGQLGLTGAYNPVANFVGIALPQITNATNTTSLLLGTRTIPSGNYGIYDMTGYPSYLSGPITTSSVSCSPTISSGTSVPTTTPVKVGDMFIDTSAKKIYVATGTTSSSDWTILN
jgi:uncharacterized protein (TIGR02145 family)